MHSTPVGTSRRCAVRAADGGRALPVVRSKKSKTARNPASVLPLPVGEGRRIDCRFKIAGTASNWAWGKLGKLFRTQRARRGCSRRASSFSVSVVAKGIRQFAEPGQLV